MESAVQDAHARAAGLTSFLSVTSNAAIGDLSLDICFNATEGSLDHDVIQHFADMPLQNLIDRLAPQDEYRAVLARVATSDDFARIFRAVQQYALALSHRRPGSELLTLAHLWMSVEALTKAVLRRQIQMLGSEDAVLYAWSIERGQLDAEVRRRVIFAGNGRLHQKVKRASDAFEHGFEDFGVIREATASLVPEAAAAVRSTIFAVVGLGEETSVKLLAEPFAEPLGVSPIVRELRAILRGPVDRLTAPGQKYPHFRLTSRLESITPCDAGRATYQSLEELDPVVEEGVEWVVTSLRMLGIDADIRVANQWQEDN